MESFLGIAPCTKEKIWDLRPTSGSVEAIEAYTGPQFLLAKALLKGRVERLVILSAKYGFLNPSDTIPETYDVTFSRKHDPYISLRCLKKQADEMGLLQFKNIISLGNQDYQDRVNKVFLGAHIRSPLEGQDFNRLFADF